MSGRLLAALFLAVSSCGSSVALDAPEPTPQRPRVGCIADSPVPAMQIRAKTEHNGRLLPETVRVIGVYASASGEQWKVLRSGEFNVDNWQPWPKAKIQFSGCGPETDAVSAMSRAPADPTTH